MRKQQSAANLAVPLCVLNALDGVAAGEGRLLFATTNHRERLDRALTRPGRIDKQIEIGFADRDQLRRLFLRFFDNCDFSLAQNFANNLPEGRLAMSAVQTFLIEHAQSPDAASLDADDWFADYRLSQWLPDEPYDSLQNHPAAGELGLWRMDLHASSSLFDFMRRIALLLER
jgi:hypothetical protein